MSSNESNLNEAIDACRPGGEDLGLPEMSDLAARIDEDVETRRLFSRCQQLDSSIGKVFDEVDVPDDLCTKLLSQFSEPTKEPEKKSIAPKVERPAKRETSRKWLRVGVGGAITASLMVVVITAAILLPGSNRISSELLYEESLFWHQKIVAKSFDAKMNSAPIDEYPLSDVVMVPPTGWQKIGTKYDSDAIVYDLRSNSGQATAALVVVRSDTRFAVGRILSSDPGSTTRGISLGASQKDGLLYILIIEGSKKRFQRFVKISPPVT